MEKLLGEAYKYIIGCCSLDRITEIRIRLRQKILIKTYRTEMFVPFVVDEEYIDYFLGQITNNSRYAHEEEISEGYIEYKNGIRVGLIGEGWIKNGVTVFRRFYSFCVRFPHYTGITVELPSRIVDNFENTLLISPPYGGKTTLLREIIYRLSDSFDVLAIDERGELFGKDMTFPIGQRCDVIQGIPKKYAFERIIRTMSPHIVACDELFGDEDYKAVERLIMSGIKVAATFHAEKKLPIILERIFVNKIYLSSKPHPGSIKLIVYGREER